MENPSSTPASKGVRLVGYSIFALLIAMVVGLALEFHFRTQPDYGRAGFKFDADLIYRLSPNLVAQKALAWGKTDEPPFSLRFNKQGFRGSDFEASKKEENPNGIYMEWDHHYDQDGHDWVAKALFENIK